MQVRVKRAHKVFKVCKAYKALVLFGVKLFLLITFIQKMMLHIIMEAALLLYTLQNLPVNIQN